MTVRRLHAWIRHPLMDYDHCASCGIARNDRTESRGCHGAPLVQHRYPRDFAAVMPGSKSPVIDAVWVIGPATIDIGAHGMPKAITAINLAGWIGMGGEDLAGLRQSTEFAKARVGSHGGSICWDDNEDVSIDVVHLSLLAEMQRPFTGADLIAWQTRMGLSNTEAAGMFDRSLSAWSGYRNGRQIPGAIKIVCHATARDPIIMNAHYRPRATTECRR